MRKAIRPQANSILSRRIDENDQRRLSALNRLSFAIRICDPSEPADRCRKTQSGYGKDGHLVHLFQCHAHFHRISHGRVRTTFKSRADRESHLDQTPGFFLQGACPVALLSQLVKRLPDLWVTLSELLDRFWQRRF